MPHPYDLPQVLNPHLGADLDVEGAAAVLPLLIDDLAILGCIVLHG